MVAPFQLRPEKKDTVVCPLSRHSNYDRKKRYSRLAIICCAIPIAIVAPLQLRPEKKDTVVCPLLCHSKYNQKKKETNRGKIIYEKKNFTIYCSCTVPIVVWPSFIAPFQLPLLRRSNYDRKKKIQSSVRCYAVPNTTGKKRNKRGKSYL